MTRSRHSYDEECERLARNFLADDPGATDTDAQDLAQHIQEAVEDWLSVEFGRNTAEFKQAIAEFNGDKRVAERCGGSKERE